MKKMKPLFAMVGISIVVSFFSMMITYKVFIRELDELNRTGKIPIRSFLGALTGANPKAAPVPSACEQDAAKFCSSNRNNFCLREQFDNLSQACAIEISDSVVAELADCRQDYENFCKDVKPGRGRIKACLLMKTDTITNACRTQLTGK